MIRHGRGSGRTVSTYVTDDFERASLGSNWTLQTGNAGIANSSDLGILAGAFDVAYWAPTVFGADQYTEITVSSNKVSNVMCQACVRRRASDNARYAFHWDDDAGDSEPTPMWAIKYDGVPTPDVVLLVSDTTRAPLVNGDVLRLEARGQSPVNLKAYLNGRLILEANDSATTRIASGQPSVGMRPWVGVTPAYPSPIVESFSAGTLL